MHSVLTPLTITASGLRNTHGIVLSFCYLSEALVHQLLLCAPMFVPASPGEALWFPSLSAPVVTHRVGMCIGECGTAKSCQCDLFSLKIRSALTLV